MKLKDLFEKIKGIFNPNKRLQAAEISGKKEKRDMSPRDIRKDLKTVSMQDIVFDRLKERGANPEILKGQMGEKLWEYLCQKNNDSISRMPLEILSKEVDSTKVQDYIDQYLEGLEIDETSKDITIKENSEYKEEKREKEATFSYDSKSKEGKIVCRESENTIINDVKEGEGVKRKTRRKTMHVDSKGTIDRIKIEEGKVFDGSGDGSFTFADDVLDLDDEKSVIDIEDGVATYTNSEGNREEVELPEQMTNEKRYNGTIYDVYDIDKVNLISIKNQKSQQEEVENSEIKDEDAR